MRSEVMGPQHRRPFHAAAGLMVAALLAVTPLLEAGSTGTTSLVTPQGSGAGTANGDYVSSGLDTFYRYFIEVPAGVSRLAVQLFDADVGAGGANEENAGRDRDRNGYNSTVTYTLLDPSGTARTTRFTTGSTTAPTGGDNAWLDLYNATGNSVRDEFGAASFANNNGTANWSAAWIETDGGGAGTGAGAIRVTGGELRLQDDVSGTPSIQRQADLLGTPGLDLAMAFLTFDFRTSGNVDDDDEISVEVSANGGGSWTTLETFSNDGSGSRSYNITAFIANNTRVRFILEGGYTGTEFFFVDDVQITDGPKTAGHWELRVDMSPAVTGGDDINALGIRAHDGTADSGGTELNVYYDSHNQYGINPPGSGTTSRSYDYFPYVTSGCSVSKNDFDHDSNSGTTGSMTFASRTGAFSQSFTSAALSANDVWRRDTIAGWTSDQLATDYGIWSTDLTITSYLVNGTPNGNYANLYLGTFQAAANPPAANPTANTFRVYLPTDAAAAPVKPYLEQLLTFKSGPNPVLVGQTARYSVTVRLVNPTPQAVTFSTPSNVVTARVPGAGAVYAGNVQVGQGTIVSQPAVGGTGDVVWNPGTLAAGDTRILAYEIDVSPTIAGQRIPVTATPASGNGTRARWLDETGNTAQARAAYLFGPLCELAVTEAALLTEAVVASFGAVATAEGVAVEWATASETGTAGFELYRLGAGGRWTRVGDRLLRAVPEAPQGATYRLLDPDAATGPQSWAVVEVEADGDRRVHGPFTVAAEPGDVETLQPFTRVPHPARAAAPRRASAAGRTDTDAGHSGEDDGRVTEAAKASRRSDVLHLAVRQTGLHGITADEIAAAFDESPDKVRREIEKGRLALTRGGEPVAWLPQADGIVFYGEAVDSLYTRDAAYRLARDRGVTMERAVAAPAGGVPAADFAESRDLERDLLPATVVATDPESDYWFWDFVLGGSPGFDAKTFALEAPGAATGPASLTVRLHGATATGIAGEHHVTVSLNGTLLGESQWQGIAPQVATFAVAPALLTGAGDQVEVRGLLDSGAPFSVVYVDGFELAYPRRFRAVGDALRFRVGAEPLVTVGGFSTAAVLLLDVTDPASPRAVDGGVVDADPEGGFRLSFAPTPGAAYAAAAAGALLSPVATRPWRDADLASSRNRGEYLVITTAELREAAERLAADRARQRLTTMVVELEEIQDEFAGGAASPHAVRDFLALAYATWRTPPHYVVLAGAGTLDYRDLLGLGGNLVPPLMAPSAGSLFPADNRFGDVDGDGLPEMAVGRIPVATAAELDAYREKVAAYEAADGTGWASSALVLADATDRGADFTAASDRAAALLPPGYQAELISLQTTPVPLAHDLLLQGLDQGASLVAYIGHGGLDRLSAGGLLDNADVPGLANAPHLPVVTAMTCAVNRFAVPGVPALGALLATAPNGGAAAVWAPSGLSVDAEAGLLAERFNRRLADPRLRRLGDLVLGALGDFQELGGSRTMLDIYTLLGDPALVVKRPAAPPASPGPATGE